MARKLLTGADVNNQKIVNLADPSAATDAVNLQTLQSYINGLRWKQPVRAASTANLNLAAPGASIDGVTMATNDRFLAKDQTTGADKGIYVWNGAAVAATRAADADTATELVGAAVLVTEGSTNADKAYVQTVDTITLGTTPLTFTQFGAGTAYTADGQGIELSSTTFSLELDGSSLSKSASGLRIASAAAGAGLVESSGILAVGQGTGIVVNANDVAIDPSVVCRKYSALYGNGSATTFNLTHGLGSQNLDVTILNATTGEVVEADVFLPPAGTTIDITHATAPTSNQYRVVAVG